MVIVTAQPLAVKPLTTPKTPRPLSTQLAGTIRTREVAQLDSPATSTDSPIKSPAKRVKFGLDAPVDSASVSPMEREWPTSQDFIRNEVRLAIDQRLSGARDGDENVYQDVINIFKTGVEPTSETAPPAVRYDYTAALIGQVSRLSKSCSQLVNAVLESDWLSRDDDYVTLFHNFLSSLVTVQGAWVLPVLNKLVRNFASRE